MAPPRRGYVAESRGIRPNLGESFHSLFSQKSNAVRTYFFFGVLTLALLPSGRSAELKPETVAGWNNYVRAQELHTKQLATRTQDPLGFDCDAELREQLRDGGVVVYPAARKGSVSVPSGLIHHWVGLAFIPHASLEQVIANARAYPRYSEFYKPSLVEAKLIRTEGAVDTFSMLMRQQVLSVNSGLYGEYQSEYHQIDSSHWYAFTHSEKLQEVRNSGKPNEERLPSDQGSGFIWRLHSTTKYEQADGGVYVELEALALSRTVPASLAWIVNPVVSKISKGALTVTLKQTREANAPQQIASY